jgi:hypothetical protein
VPTEGDQPDVTPEPASDPPATSLPAAPDPATVPIIDTAAGPPEDWGPGPLGQQISARSAQGLGTTEQMQIGQRDLGPNGPAPEPVHAQEEAGLGPNGPPEAAPAAPLPEAPESQPTED